MAWKVGLVLDSNISVPTLHTLVHKMPLWCVHSNEIESAASAIRKSAGALWEPEPSFTVFKNPSRKRREVFGDILPTMFEHHPLLSAIWLPEHLEDEELSQVAHRFELHHKVSHERGVLFARDTASANAKVLRLQASSWREPGDFYAAFFDAVGAPDWHGKNLDALHDSICGGRINTVEVPYRVDIDISEASPDIRSFLEVIQTQFSIIYKDEGCPVNVVFVES